MAALSGHCLCGSVAFEVAGPLGQAAYCHCTRCQRRTGNGSSAGVRVAPGAVTVLRGAELVKAWDPPDGNPKCFCTACGGALWSLDPATREISVVRIGVLDPGHDVRPSAHVRTATAAAWEPIPDDGLPRFEDTP
jgi:hypothetical protein